jgi:hypothetical protein
VHVKVPHLLMRVPAVVGENPIAPVDDPEDAGGLRHGPEEPGDELDRCARRKIVE